MHRACDSDANHRYAERTTNKAQRRSAPAGNNIAGTDKEVLGSTRRQSLEKNRMHFSNRETSSIGCRWVGSLVGDRVARDYQANSVTFYIGWHFLHT